eukprot:RCo002732
MASNGNGASSSANIPSLSPASTAAVAGVSPAYLAECVSVVNDLLSRCGITHTITAVSECSPSLFVLLFEGLFSSRLPNIHREKKQTGAEKLHNIRELIATLEYTVGMPLHHIDAEAIVNGDAKQLCLLIQVLKELCGVVEERRRAAEPRRRRPPTPVPPADDDDLLDFRVEEVSEWCDSVMRASNLSEQVRDVGALNPDYSQPEVEP